MNTAIPTLAAPIRAAFRTLLPLSCVLGLLLAQSTHAHAQNIGNVVSGPASGDGAAPYYNPAAMALADSVIQLDLGAAFGRIRFDPSGGGSGVLDKPIGPLLTLGGFTDAIHRDLRLGVTVGLPATAGATWDPNSEAGSITRYYLRAGTNLHIGVSPALSWTVAPWLTLGLGAQLVYGSTNSEFDKDFGAELNNMTVPPCSYDPSDGRPCLVPYADPIFAAPVSVTGSGFGAGGTFGVLARPMEELEIGVSVQTPVRITTTGRVDVVYPDTLVAAVRDLVPSAELPPLNASIRASMDLPWTIHAGVVARPVRGLELSLYYRWENQSAAPLWEVLIETASSPSIQDTGKLQGYTDRHFVRLRAGYEVIEGVAVSLFGSYQSNTVPDLTATPNNMDFDRIDLGLVAQWRVSERVGLLLQYSHLFLLSRDVSTSLHRPLTDRAFSNFNHPRPFGQWSGSADTIRLSAQFFFDR